MKNYFLMLFLSLTLLACSDSNPIIHESSENSESSIPLYECDTSTACYEAEEVKVWFGNNRLKPEQEFNIYTQIASSEVKFKSSRIEGVKMNMGYIPIFYQKNAQGVYVATGMVGACDTEDMLWQLVITYQDSQGTNKEVKVPIPIYLF